MINWKIHGNKDIDIDAKAKIANLMYNTYIFFFPPFPFLEILLFFLQNARTGNLVESVNE